MTTLLITMIPLLMLVTAATTVMTGRNSLLLRTVQQTKALLAASAGVEDAAQRAQEGGLVSGDVVDGELTTGVRYRYRADYLGNDSVDNDDDGLTDEADERAWQVESSGFHGRAESHVTALVREPASLPAFSAAILTLGDPTITTSGSALVSGADTRIDGSRGSPSLDVDGVATEPPHGASDLLGNYVQNGTGRVTGRQPTPSFGVMPAPYNLPGLVAVARGSADVVLSPGTYGAGLGDARRGDYRTTYCPGDLHLAAAGSGAGVLLVAGDLTVTGRFRWDGLVVVLGDLTVEGSALINGGVIQGPAATEIKVAGGAVVRYSSEALRPLNGRLTQAYSVEGWRETGR